MRNCKGQHTASYRGCPEHLKLQKATSSFVYKRKVDVNTNVHSFPVGTNFSNVNFSLLPALKISTNQKSYAETASGVSKVNQLEQVLTKLDSLLALLHPLITALSQILPVLVNKK